MAVTPSGPVALPLENLRTLLSNCPQWQAWTQKADAAGAYRHVHLVDVPPPPDGEYTVDDLQQLRPFAVIDEFELETLDGKPRPGGDAWVADRSARGNFEHSGKLLLRFEDDVAVGDREDPATAKLLFMNRIGDVMGDLAELGGGDGPYLSIHRLVRYGPWRRADETELGTQGDYMTVTYVVLWGV